MYFKYHKNDTNAITSRMRGQLPKLRNKNPNVHFGEKGKTAH